jgi:hypothetical protein
MMDPVLVARPNYREEPVTETTNFIDTNNQSSRSADQITIFEARESAVLLYSTEWGWYERVHIVAALPIAANLDE